MANTVFHQFIGLQNRWVRPENRCVGRCDCPLSWFIPVIIIVLLDCWGESIVSHYYAGSSIPPAFVHSESTANPQRICVSISMIRITSWGEHPPKNMPEVFFFIRAQHMGQSFLEAALFGFKGKPRGSPTSVFGVPPQVHPTTNVLVFHLVREKCQPKT